MKNILGKITKTKAKGFALPFVVLLFLFASLIFALMFELNTNNSRETVAQFNRNQSYYLALSGMDIAYAALTQEGSGAKTLLMDLNENLSEDANIKDTIDFDDLGTVDLTLTKKKVDGMDWIEILSVSKVKNHENKDVSKTIQVRVRASNAKELIWDYVGS